MNMNKNKENKLIPRLRFPEFQHSGEWGYFNGDKLFEPIVNKNHNSDLPILAITQEHGAIPRNMIDYHVSVTDSSIKSYKVVEVGDFIISLRSFQGGIEYSQFKGLCSPAYVILRKKTALENDFYRHYFKTMSFIQDLNKNLEGIRDGKMISYKQFSEILIPFPSLPEQQKIASCLSSLDEVIAGEREKLALLQQHKKGLLQHLFPQEGETVPTLRFKEFEDSGEWELKQLGIDNLIEIKGRIGYRGYTTEDIVSKGEGAISMSPSNIDENWNLNFEKSTYITWEKYEESPEIMLEDGFTVLVKTGSSYGKAAYIKGLIEKTTINPQLVVLKPKKIDSYFLYLLVSNTAIQKQINETVVGGAVPTLSQESISKFKILVPKLAEQQKIASCLSSLDDLITAQTQKIELLEQHKKGLLQGLFPNINDHG
jgi:type I restriction enzyme S subunit